MAARRKFVTLVDAIKQEVAPAVFASAQLVQTEAQILITTGAVSGKNHVPSKPGEPPNNDTGTLANNIEAVQLSELHAQVSSNASYAAILEYGSSRMSPRPYMAPALQRSRDEITKMITGAVSKATRKNFGAS